MNRRSVTFGVLGAAVLAAMVGLYVLLLPGDDAAVRDSAVAETPEPVIRRGPSPALPSLPGDDTVAGAGSDAPRERSFGNVRVRDHRSGARAPIDVPPAIHAPQSRRIPSELSYNISKRVQSAVAECAASVPAHARGPKPRFEGQITIAIKNQQATITGAVLQLRDVTGIALDAPKQCVEQKSIGSSVPSGDEPELEGYAITMSVRLP